MRTSGRTSAAIEPSLRATRIASYSPASDRHHLGYARVAGARQPLEALEQGHLGFIGQCRHRIVGRIQRPRAADPVQCRDRRLALASDRAGRRRGLRQRVEADVVGIRECGLLARDRANADAAIDRERARLDDPFLEAPAFDARILKVQVGMIDAVAMDAGKHVGQLTKLQRRRREQASGSPARGARVVREVRRYRPRGNSLNRANTRIVRAHALRHKRHRGNATIDAVGLG